MNNKAVSTIWIIRGAPGVGKSAVGRRLKMALLSSAVIEVDILRSMRANINWTDEKSHKEGLQQASALAESFVKIGLKPVIIIDTLLGENLDSLLSLLVEDPFKVTLIAEDKNLLSRAKSRTSGFENEQIILDMNHWFHLNQNASCHTIDTTLLSADEVADKILELAHFPEVQLSQRINEKVPKIVESPNSTNPNRPAGKLYLIRHSEPDKTFSGPYNIPPGPPLSRLGISKAEHLRDFFKVIRFQKIVCSSFERAQQTASIIGGSKFMPVESDAWDEVAPSEPFSDVKKRVSGWLLANLPVNDEITLVVGHGATLNAAIEFYEPKVFKEAERDRYGNIVEKAGVWMIEWSNGKIIYCGSVEV